MPFSRTRGTEGSATEGVVDGVDELFEEVLEHLEDDSLGMSASTIGLECGPMY
jgi:hypothetical protein